MMKARPFAGKLLAATLAAAMATEAHAAPPRPARGSLVLLLVVDQLRLQDVLWLADELGPRGFAGLGPPTAMRYETAVTETAPAHATLSTGVYADVHGIIGNRFIDRDAKREMVEDPACPVWGAPRAPGRSGALLMAPTLSDALRLGTNGRSRSIALGGKDRSALYLGGPSADLALWPEVASGELASTTCYAPEPPAWLSDFNRAHPLSQWKDFVWTPLDAAAVARFVPLAENPAARPWNDIGPVFPHRIGNGAVDRRLALAARESPLNNELILAAARAAVEALGLGNQGGADFLAVSLSALDYVGHQFGTVSRERVDAVLRTHAGARSFVEWLRGRLGNRLAVVLTADHGATATPEEQARLHVHGGGAIDPDALAAKLNRALDDGLGARKEGWIASLDANAVWFRRPVPPRATEIAVEVLRQEPGVHRIHGRDDLALADAAVQHAIFPGRSGDLFFVLRPLWSLKNPKYSAEHGSLWNDDALVPLAIAARGWKLRPGVARATQIAPTVAMLLGVSPPAAAQDEPAIARE